MNANFQIDSMRRPRSRRWAIAALCAASMFAIVANAQFDCSFAPNPCEKKRRFNFALKNLLLVIAGRALDVKN